MIFNYVKSVKYINLFFFIDCTIWWQIKYKKVSSIKNVKYRRSSCIQKAALKNAWYNYKIIFLKEGKKKGVKYRRNLKHLENIIKHS